MLTAPVPPMMVSLPEPPKKVIVPAPPLTVTDGPLALMVTAPLPALTVSAPVVVIVPPAEPGLYVVPDSLAAGCDPVLALAPDGCGAATDADPPGDAPAP